MADIFISYASEDRNRVIPIVKALEAQGWSTFWDWKSIPVGKTWRQFIKEGLDEARCILVLWSEKSIESEWVIEEADYGKAKRILIPTLIDDVHPPIGLGQIHSARIIGWKGESDHAGFQRLVEALTGLLKFPEADLQHKIANSIGMEFVLIRAGSFTMGSNSGAEDERPQHKVKISQPFYLQTTVVSQGQWTKVMGNNPSSNKEGGDNSPVENVSWKDCQRFITKLNQFEKAKGYRLPSEAEWEYACRAGTTTEYSFGDDVSKLGEYAWYDGNSGNTTHSGCKKKSNSWGLYDMQGNVWEWVEDDLHESYEGAPNEGLAWVDNPRSSYRVIRGGSWNSCAYDCRTARRHLYWPGDRIFTVGFRLSRSVALGP